MPAVPDTSSPAALLAEEALAPIIEWVHAERGRKTEFVRAVQDAAAPATLSRNVIESWIAPDPSKRAAPLFPNGLLLLQVADAILHPKRKAKRTSNPTPTP